VIGVTGNPSLVHSPANVSRACCIVRTVSAGKAVGARLYPHSKQDLIFWKYELEQTVAVAVNAVPPPVKSELAWSLSALHEASHCDEIPDVAGARGTRTEAEAVRAGHGRSQHPYKWSRRVGR